MLRIRDATEKNLPAILEIYNQIRVGEGYFTTAEHTVHISSNHRH